MTEHDPVQEPDIAPFHIDTYSIHNTVTALVHTINEVISRINTLQDRVYKMEQALFKRPILDESVRLIRE